MPDCFTVIGSSPPSCCTQSKMDAAAPFSLSASARDPYQLCKMRKVAGANHPHKLSAGARATQSPRFHH